MDVDKALEELEELFRWGFEEKWSNLRKFGNLIQVIGESRVSFTSEQHSHLFNIAIDVFNKGVSKVGLFSTIDHFSRLLLNSGYRASEWNNHAEYVNPKNPELLAVKFELAVELLKRNNILKSGEPIELVDFGTFGIGGRDRFRTGVLIQTQTRIFAVGEDHRGNRNCYILYPDRAEHAYYRTMDYIDFEPEDKVELTRSILFGKLIDITKKSIRHSRTYPRVIPGPSFIDYRLPDGGYVQTGELFIRISLRSFGNRSRKNERTQKLLRAIAGGIASAGREGETVELPDMSMNTPIIIIRLILAVTIAVIVIVYLLVTYVF